MKKSKKIVLILLLGCMFGLLNFVGIDIHTKANLYYNKSNYNEIANRLSSDPPTPPYIPQQLIFGVISGPVDLDPQFAYDRRSQQTISQICEGLYKYNTSDPLSSLIPVLATVLPTISPDGLNLTIQLRTGVTFSDGTPFNATAVRWNLDRLNYFLNYSGNKYLPAPFNVPLPSDGSIQKTRVENLFTSKGVPVINRTEIIGLYSVKIVMNFPKASFINMLTFHSTFFHSPTSARSQGKELDYLRYEDGDTLIGTGPFVLQWYVPNIEVRFTRNLNYWQGAPILEKLIWAIFDDPNILGSAVLAGDIDLCDSPSPSFFNVFEADPGITLLEAGPTLDTMYMGFNGFMVNTTFRKAISYAINYSNLIDTVLGGEGFRLKSPIPYCVPMSNYSFNYPLFDRVYAQSIMQSMGYGTNFTTDAQWIAVADGGGWGFGWNITVNAESPSRIDFAQHISDSLKYLGINASVVQVYFSNLLSCIQNNIGPYRRDMIPMYMMGWTPDYIDPENYITPLFSNTSSLCVNTYDPELQVLIHAGEITVDHAARQTIYNQIQQKLVEELFFHAWIATGKNYDVYQNNVKGWVPNAINRLDFYPVYLNITDYTAPLINIQQPIPNRIFSSNAPTFSITITDQSLINSTWYTLDDGLTNYTFSGITGTINQTAWDYANSGPITLKFYANDSVGNLGFAVVNIIKDIDAPIITINTPTAYQLYGVAAPNFDVQIIDADLYLKLYSINGRPNVTFTTETQFDQVEWDNIGNGTVIVVFYAIDGAGNINSSQVFIRKDAILPVITVNSPTEYAAFAKPPEFTITIIEEDLVSTWYAVQGTASPILFIGFNGTIDQTAWNNAPEENVTITFYAQDRAGNIGIKTVTVIKSVPNPGPLIPGYIPIVLIGVLSVATILLSKKLKKSYY